MRIAKQDKQITTRQREYVYNRDEITTRQSQGNNMKIKEMKLRQGKQKNMKIIEIKFRQDK